MLNVEPEQMPKDAQLLMLRWVSVQPQLVNCASQLYMRSCVQFLARSFEGHH